MKKSSVAIPARQDGATITISKPGTPGSGGDKKIGSGLTLALAKPTSPSGDKKDSSSNLLMKKLLAKNKAEEANDTSREESCKRNSMAPRPSVSGGSVSTQRLSIAGLMASRRFAKRLMSKAAEKKESTIDTAPSVLYEPTYRLEPKTKFDPSAVLNIVKNVLENRVGDMKYNPRIAPNMNRILGDEVKDKVKKLNYDRYKIVVIVMIGEKKGQGIKITSRCSWDDKVDNFVTHTCQNKHIFCTCSVYGTYKE